MNRIATPLLAIGLALAAAPASASLTVTPAVKVTNLCTSQIVIAVRYKDIRGPWRTTDFTSVRARGSHERVASTGNSIVYIYAETQPRGRRWSGTHNVQVAGKTYPMKRMQLSLRNNRYDVRLSC